MNEELGEKTRALLRDAITSFEMLEIFLLLRAEPGVSWTVRAVGNRLHMADELVERAVAGLRDCNLVRGYAGNTGEFIYGPGNEALVIASDQLAADFAERRAAVLSTMSTNAIERLRSGAVSAFADAFILGSKRKDG